MYFKKDTTQHSNDQQLIYLGVLEIDEAFKVYMMQLQKKSEYISANVSNFTRFLY